MFSELSHATSRRKTKQMPEFLGVDTSNYTTSAAVYVSEKNKIYQCKKLLPVKEGELGLRQSDAVFHHTKQLPDMMEQLFAENKLSAPMTVTASARPRNIEGSYMPCFLCGEGFARSYSAAVGAKLYKQKPYLQKEAETAFLPSLSHLLLIYTQDRQLTG